MKIAYNPSGQSPLTIASMEIQSNDIIFDIPGSAIWTRGYKFDGKSYDRFSKGRDGLVPAPNYTATAVRFLREDGTWVIPTNTDTKTTTFTTSPEATEGWYRIAQTTIDVGNNVGTFQIVAQRSGRHTAFTVNASISFGKNPNISILQCSQYTNPAIDQVRLVYNSDYQGNYAYLEIKLLNPASSLTINVTRHGFGWTLLETAQAADSNISDGYSQISLQLLNKTIYSENLKAKSLYVEGNTNGTFEEGKDDNSVAIVYTRQFYENSYSPILKATTHSGNIVNLGGKNNIFGIYSYLPTDEIPSRYALFDTSSGDCQFSGNVTINAYNADKFITFKNSDTQNTGWRIGYNDNNLTVRFSETSDSWSDVIQMTSDLNTGFRGNIVPLSNNITKMCGTTSNRWNDVYAINGDFSTKVTTPLVTFSSNLTINGNDVYIKYNNNSQNSVALTHKCFQPFIDANKKLNLGSDTARWSNVYSVNGNFTGPITTSCATGRHIDGNQGNAIINSTASGEFYTMLAKMNSLAGVFTIGSYQREFNLYWTDNATIDLGENKTTHTLKLLDESGNSSFPQNVLVKGGVTASYFGHAWESTFTPGQWNRLCYVERCNENYVGASFIINLQEHRTSYVYNMTYLVNTHHEQKGHVTMLNGSTYNHSGYVRTRVIVDTYGNCYFEFKDDGPSTGCKVRCRLLPIACGSITTFTTAVDGEKELSGYVASIEHVKNGIGIPNSTIYHYTPINNITGSLEQHDTVTINNKDLSDDYCIFKQELTVPPYCDYKITLDKNQQFALWYIKNATSKDPTDPTVQLNRTLQQNYKIKINDDIISQGDVSILQDLTVNHDGKNTSDSPLTLKIRVYLTMENRSNITNNQIVYINGSPTYYEIYNSNNFSYTTKLNDYNFNNSIKFDYTLSRSGGVLKDSENNSYNNGCVYSNSTNQSLTYYNKDEFFIQRGNYCLKLTQSGLQKSSDKGLTWSNL